MMLPVIVSLAAFGVLSASCRQTASDEYPEPVAGVTKLYTTTPPGASQQPTIATATRVIAHRALRTAI